MPEPTVRGRVASSWGSEGGELDAIDSSIIDACLSSVRVEAGLDEESVLPPIEEIVAPRLVVDQRLPSAESIVRASVKPIAAPQASTPSSVNRDEVTARPRQRPTFVQRMRWPVFLCGFVAGVCGGVALMKSPVGKQPTVQRAVKTIHNGAVAAVAATAAAKSRLVNP